METLKLPRKLEEARAVLAEASTEAEIHKDDDAGVQEQFATIRRGLTRAMQDAEANETDSARRTAAQNTAREEAAEVRYALRQCEACNAYAARKRAVIEATQKVEALEKSLATHLSSQGRRQTRGASASAMRAGRRVQHPQVRWRSSARAPGARAPPRYRRGAVGATRGRHQPRRGARARRRRPTRCPQPKR